MGRALILLLAAGFGFGCAPSPSAVSTPEGPGGDAGISALRDCATVTSRCAGVGAVRAAAPALCSVTEAGPVCHATRRTVAAGTSSRQAGAVYTERLAAMETGAGICGFHAVSRGGQGFGPGEFAILGIWGTRAGVHQYRRARYLPQPAMAELLDDPARFVQACAALVSRVPGG